MSNFYKRTITGSLIVAFIVGSILLGKISFFFLCLLIIFFGTKEFYSLATIEHVKPQKKYGIVISMLTFIMFYFFFQKIGDKKIFLPVIPIIISIFIIELYRKEKHPFQNIAYTILGILYIALPISFFNYLVFRGENTISYSSDILLGFFILMWTYDTGAYIAGLLFGSTPLFRRISPKKTWEGLIGGSIFALAAGWLLSTFFEDLRLVDWEVIAFIVVVMGTLGDLVESLFKRSISVKESGHLLPGHGGVLDRFDGVFLSAPIVYTYLNLIY